MLPRNLTAILFGLCLAAGCHRLPALRGSVTPPAAATPVVVVPEPQLVVPVPLGPGEALIGPAAAPFYLPPGAPPPAAPQAGVPPFPSPTPAAVAPRPGLLDNLLDSNGAISPRLGLPSGPTLADRLPNPLVVPIANAELAWDQLADVVSDFFPIAREQPVQLLDGVLTEGLIETAPQVGATIFEPHRPDSVGRFNRLQATFQTVRRRAILNVTPTAGGYAIAVQAPKELEDLPRPQGATAGAAVLRNDNALPNARLPLDEQLGSSDRWIPIGRDEPLEQEILRRVRDRLAGGAG